MGYGDVTRWNCSKKDTVADSTIEFKYIMTLGVAKEDLRIRNFLMGLHVVQDTSNPLEAYRENNGTILQAKEPRNQHKTIILTRDITLFESLSMSLM